MDEESDVDKGSTELFCGRVMHILDPQNFWIQIGTQISFEEFASLEVSFKEFCDEMGTFPPLPAQSIEEGSYVLVKSAVDTGKCKRAQVARTNKEKGMVDVFYLDYGNTELVSTSTLCQAVPIYFFSVNVELMKCGLAGIRPIAKTWTGRGIKCFEKLTKEKILKAAIISFNPMEMLNEISLYAQDKEQKSVTHILLEEEIGLPTATLDSIPECADDVTQVLPDSYYEWYNNIEKQDEDSKMQEIDEIHDFPKEMEEDGKTSQTYEKSLQESDQMTKSSLDESDKIAKASVQESDTITKTSLLVSKQNTKTSVHKSDHITKHSGHKSDSVTETLPEPDQINRFVNSDNNNIKADRGPESPENPSPAVIPGFDMSEIFRTTMACPDILEKKKDIERKKEAKLELQRDIETIHEDTLEPLESDSWEMTDLIIGKDRAVKNDGTISDKIAQIEEVTGSLIEITSSSPIIPTKKHDDDQPDVSPIVKNCSPLLPSWISPAMADSSSGCQEKDHSGDESDTSESTLIKQMTEIELYEFSKQLQEVLLCNDSDAGIVIDEFHKIVPIDRVRQPLGLPAALDVLVENAVKNSNRQGLALTVIDSYSECADFENTLKKTLTDSNIRFIRIPRGKTSGYHSDFARVLGQIFLYSRLWASSDCDIVQDYILAACEKWVYFSKNTDALKPRTKRLMEIYCDCLEAFWHVAGDVVHDVSQAKHRSVQTELRDRILCDNTDRNLRQRYLVLLLSMQQPGMMVYASKPTMHDVYSQTDIQTSCSVEVQTDEELAPHLIPYIIPNIKTSRVSNQWKGSPCHAEGVMKSPPSTSLSDDLTRYRSWAQCVTDGRKGHSEDPANNTNQLKHLALRKLGSVRHNQSGKEIAPKFRNLLANNRGDGDSVKIGSWKQHSEDDDGLHLRDSDFKSTNDSSNTGGKSVYPSNSSLSENADIDMADTSLSRATPSGEDTTSNRTQYDSRPQHTSTQSDISCSSDFHRPEHSYELSLNTSSFSKEAPLPTKTTCVSPFNNLSNPDSRNSSKYDKQNKEFDSPSMRNMSANLRKSLESPFKKNVDRLSDTVPADRSSVDNVISPLREKSNSGSNSPLFDRPDSGNKRESVKCVDSISEKYLPSRLRKSIMTSVKKDASSVPVKKKDAVIDWWEAGDSQTFPLSPKNEKVDNVFKDLCSPVPSYKKHSKTRSAKESLLSIVEDILGGNKSRAEEYDGQASDTDTSGGDVTSWSERDVDGKDIRCWTDQEIRSTDQNDVLLAETTSVQMENNNTKDIKAMKLVPDYVSGLDFEDDFDDDDDNDENFMLDFEEVDYAKIVEDSFSIGDGLQPNPQVITVSSPKKPVRTYKWVPGKRKCTMCSSVEHVASDCPHRATHQIIN